MPQWSCPCGRLAVQPKGWMTWRWGRSCWSLGAVTSRMWKVPLPHLHSTFIHFCPAAWCSLVSFASSVGYRLSHAASRMQDRRAVWYAVLLSAYRGTPLLCMGSTSCCHVLLRTTTICCSRLNSIPCSLPTPAHSPFLLTPHSCSFPNSLP